MGEFTDACVPARLTYRVSNKKPCVEVEGEDGGCPRTSSGTVWPTRLAKLATSRPVRDQGIVVRMSKGIGAVLLDTSVLQCI